MRRVIRADAWRPVGGITLDAPALEAVCSSGNIVVMAGPGAGKTELLAQRACYLLQTGGCPSPRRILAISFKKDAATNLCDRVKQRCGKDLGQRLDSFTYDAFSKSLLDRFLPALPDDWRPDVNYVVLPDYKSQFRDAMQGMSLPSRFGSARLSSDDIKRATDQHGRFPLPFLPEEQTDTLSWLCAKVWRLLVKDTEPSTLTFPMITRFAELLLRENPYVLRALRATYSHVFLDEFQDTTYWQYDLVRTAFLGGNATITAVGDTKQRIMGWAGALPNAFEEYERDFSAQRHDLVINYRSAPRLVEIQQVLAERIDCNAAMVRSGRGGAEAGTCDILAFADSRQEAKILAGMISKWVDEEKLDPRQICVLAKQKVAIYGNELIEELRQYGIKARDEGAYQELLIEPVVVTMLAFIELAVKQRAPEAWNHVIQILSDIRGYGGDTTYEKTRRLEEGLQTYVANLKAQLIGGGIASEKDLRDTVVDVFDFIGVAPFRHLFPQYVQGAYFEQQLERATSLLWKAMQMNSDWPTVIDEFNGVETIPVMTVHKSKGLEYDTVVFIGLESSAFWSFQTQQDADTNAFFVALSRARRRLFFTFSGVRQTGREGQAEAQSTTTVKLLYELLQEAGVPVSDLSG